ncbi:hypothetical protein [Thiosocius teredinicola]|uniref:hypothetical protein n=1 Tax=Thiosocius teredinicola TaxID=1973002 RepID=UPI00099114C8
MESGSSSELKALIPRFIIWGTLIVVLTYGKILWPLMFGYMKEEGATFVQALGHFPLHAMAFSGLCIAGLIGYSWARLRCRANEQ